MNCHVASRLLSAERDGTLAPHERAGLDGHVAGCAECRTARIDLAMAIDEWRSATANLKVPDAQRAWLDIRRKIRAGQPPPSSERSGARRFVRWSIPLGAAAALVVAVSTVSPRWLSKPPAIGLAPPQVARADFVEVPSDSSSMVYVDDQSGWLVVWAVTDLHPAGG